MRNVLIIQENGLFNDRNPTNMGIEKKWINQLNNINNNIATLHPHIKLHKPKLEIRPIVSKNLTINHTMGKILNEILRDIKNNWDKENNFNHNITNIENIAIDIQNQEYNENDTMYVLDIKDMFNTINKGKLVVILQEIISNQKNLKYNAETLIRLIKFDLFHSNLFQYKSILYAQKIGLPMGAPTSGIYAEMYVDFYINIKKNRLTSAGVKYLKKYVDDILIIGNITDHTSITKIMETKTELKFTIDKQNNDNIDYLDIKLIKTGTQTKTKWNKKPSHQTDY